MDSAVLQIDCRHLISVGRGGGGAIKFNHNITNERRQSLIILRCTAYGPATLVNETDIYNRSKLLVASWWLTCAVIL